MEDSGIDSGDHNGDLIGRNSNGSDSSTSSVDHFRSPKSSALKSTSTANRQLQRKLEARLENARRLHNHHDYNNLSALNMNSCNSNLTGLIPIQRLPIPGAKDHQPLVQWDTDDSEEDIVNFFPLSRKESRAHQELTDTFSIEEMSISGDEDDEDDLHLVPPTTVYKRFGCCPYSCVIV